MICRWWHSGWFSFFFLFPISSMFPTIGIFYYCNSKTKKNDIFLEYSSTGKYLARRRNNCNAISLKAGICFAPPPHCLASSQSPRVESVLKAHPLTGGSSILLNQSSCLGCYNKTPWTGWLVNHRKLCLTVLESRILRSRYQHGCVRGFFQAADFSVYAHTVKEHKNSLDPFL